MATKPRPLGLDSPAAIKRFQRDQGLTDDGIWGPKSQAAYNRIGNWLDPGTGLNMSVANASPLSGFTPAQMTTTTVPTSSSTTTASNSTGSTIGSIASSLAPFASNIINTFRKPPVPRAPRLNSAITLNKVNYNADRADLERTVRGADIGAERTLSGNTSEAVKAANLATRIGAMSRINQAENNANTEIGNKQNIINSQIQQGNNESIDRYNDSLVNREIAQQSQSSANIANAADKFVALQNEEAKRDLDLKRFGVLSRMYSPGVLDRMQQFYKNQGIDDSLNTGRREYGGSLKKKVKVY